jgi:hypothetical protein
MPGTPASISNTVAPSSSPPSGRPTCIIRIRAPSKDRSTSQSLS